MDSGGNQLPLIVNQTTRLVGAGEGEKSIFMRKGLERTPPTSATDVTNKVTVAAKNDHYDSPKRRNGSSSSGARKRGENNISPQTGTQSKRVCEKGSERSGQKMSNNLIRTDDELSVTTRIVAEVQELVTNDKNKVSKTVGTNIMKLVLELQEQVIRGLLSVNRLTGQVHELREVAYGAVEKPLFAEMVRSHGSEVETVSVPNLVHKEKLKKRTRRLTKSHSLLIKSKDSDAAIEAVKDTFTVKLKDCMKSFKFQSISTSKKGLIVRVSNTRDLETIKSCKELKDSGLEASAIKDKGPRVIIFGIPGEFTNNVLKEELLHRNVDDKWHENAVIEVDKIFQDKNNNYNAIIEIDPQTKTRWIKNGRVYLEYSSFRVANYVDVPQCLNCFGYNHHTRNCTIGTLCRRCGESGHRAADCTIAGFKCRNCQSKGMPFDHSCTSGQCPEFRMARSKEKSKYAEYN